MASRVDSLVLGYVVCDPADLTQMKVPEGETVVRVPVELFSYLPKGD